MRFYKKGCIKLNSKKIAMLLSAILLLSGCSISENNETNSINEKVESVVNNTHIKNDQSSEANNVGVKGKTHETGAEYKERIKTFIQRDYISNLSEVMKEVNESTKFGFKKLKPPVSDGYTFELYELTQEDEENLRTYLQTIKIMKNLEYKKVELYEYEMFLDMNYQIGPLLKSADSTAVWYGISQELNLLFIAMDDTIIGFNVVNDDEFFVKVDAYFNKASLKKDY